MRRRPPPQGPVGIDDATGFKVDHASLKKQWDGHMVVDPDRRNPQDHLRARPERAGIPNPRPEPADTFLAGNIVWEDGTTYMATESGDAMMLEGELGGTGL